LTVARLVGLNLFFFCVSGFPDEEAIPLK